MPPDEERILGVLFHNQTICCWVSMRGYFEHQNLSFKLMDKKLITFCLTILPILEPRLNIVSQISRARMAYVWLERLST